MSAVPYTSGFILRFAVFFQYGLIITHKNSLIHTHKGYIIVLKDQSMFGTPVLDINKTNKKQKQKKYDNLFFKKM